MVEKVPAMDGRRDAPSFRVKRIGPIRPAGQIALSNWTTSPVQSDRTDTPNLERQGCPGCGLRRAQSIRELSGPKIRSRNDEGSTKHEIRNKSLLRASSFGFPSSFGFRASSFTLLGLEDSTHPLALPHSETGYLSFNRNSGCFSR